MSFLNNILDERYIWRNLVIALILLWLYNSFGKKNMEFFSTGDRMLFLALDGLERRDFFKKYNFSALNTSSSLPFSPIAVLPNNFDTMMAVLNAYGCLYLSCADSDKQRVVDFFVDQLSSWVDAGMDLNKVPTSQWNLFPDIFVHLHKFANDPSIQLNVGKVNKINNALSLFFDKALSVYVKSNKFNENVAVSWAVTCKLLIAILDENKATGQNMTDILSYTVKSANASSLAWALEDKTGLRFCTLIKYFTHTLLGLHAAKVAGFTTDYGLGEFRELCKNIVNVYVTQSGITVAVDNMEKADSSGLIWSWTVLANRLDGTLSNDMNFKSAYVKVKEHLYSGIAGSTWLHFGENI